MRDDLRQRQRVRRGAADARLARVDLAHSLAALVETLTQAHALAAGGASPADLAAMLDRARGALDHADEKLLRLDRRRQRSLFRRAGIIRHRLAYLERSVAARDS